jgi:hypothetical protein
MASNPSLLVQGVVLYCSGEQKDNANPEFELVSVSHDGSIFSMPVCEISELVGIPIQIMRVHTHADVTRRSNANATFLKIQLKGSGDTNSSSNEVGLAQDEWKVPVGNVVAARVDKQPLNIETMQVLCDFCAVRVIRVLEEASERNESAEQVQEIIKQEFTKKAFRTYADEYDTRENRSGRPFRFFSVFNNM